MFPFRVAPFSEGSKTILTELPPFDVYQFLLRNISVLNFSVAPSSVYLLESSSSEGVEPHGSFSSARLSVYDETSDIETDGLNHGCQRNPYGEVQRYTSSGPSNEFLFYISSRKHTYIILTPINPTYI